MYVEGMEAKDVARKALAKSEFDRAQREGDVRRLKTLQSQIEQQRLEMADATLKMAYNFDAALEDVEDEYSRKASPLDADHGFLLVGDAHVTEGEHQASAMDRLRAQQGHDESGMSAMDRLRARDAQAGSGNDHELLADNDDIAHMHAESPHLVRSHLNATDREIEDVVGLDAEEEKRRAAMAERMEKWRLASENTNI